VQRVRVVDLVGLDPEVEAALWQFVIEIDLVTHVRAGHRPVDEPLRWRLADPRRWRVMHLGDHLWVRVVDPAVALAARRYEVADALVLELGDSFLPHNDGCWLVDGSPDGAVVTRTDRAPDLACAASDLGSMYLGGVAASTLAAAGRVQEVTPGALARADRFFASRPAPWCSTEF
jgi:predicted acetyltransferase